MFDFNDIFGFVAMVMTLMLIFHPVYRYTVREWHLAEN